jgi:hypothetical protein
MPDAADAKSATDFRRHAFAASTSVLRGPRSAEAATAPDILSAGLSLCIPTADDADAIRARLRRSLVMYMVLGIGGVVVGGVIAFWRKHAAPGPGFDAWIAVALANSLSGFVLLFLGMRQERRFVRKVVLERLGGSLPARPTYVNVEDPSTFDDETRLGGRRPAVRAPRRSMRADRRDHSAVPDLRPRRGPIGEDPGREVGRGAAQLPDRRRHASGRAEGLGRLGGGAGAAHQALAAARQAAPRVRDEHSATRGSARKKVPDPFF